jgi:hypothetical protein
LDSYRFRAMEQFQEQLQSGAHLTAAAVGSNGNPNLNWMNGTTTFNNNNNGTLNSARGLGEDNGNQNKSRYIEEILKMNLLDA